MNYDKNQPQTIKKMFGSIAQNYDRTNAILSFGLHKKWNNMLVKHVARHQCLDLLDLCAGTGDIALAFAKKTPLKSLCLIDFCSEMLEIAKIKAHKENMHHFQYIEADAQSLPLNNQSVDAVTTAYGIRNVKDFSQCASEVFRVLRPDGVFGILELTQPSQSLLRMGHKVYLSTILPLLGKLITKDRQAYEYLSRSIQEFIEPKKIELILLQSGFKKTCSIPLMGGVATIIMGQKCSSDTFV